MFQHLFAVMNETLDQIMEDYAASGGESKKLYDEQLCELKKISDSLIEQWLLFEEKLSDFNDVHKGKAVPVGGGQPKPQGMNSPASAAAQAASAAQASNTAAASQIAAAEASAGAEEFAVPYDMAEEFNAGQGYYKLFMFQEAAACFRNVLESSPESNLVRLFLGMSYMHLQNWSEAQRHFQLLVSFTDFPKWQALGYNALGCIQAVRLNMDYAERLFMKAYEVYPAFTDSLSNLKSCKESPQHLSLFFGSTELCCL